MDTHPPPLSAPQTLLASLLFVASSAFCDAVAPMLSSCFPDCLPVPSGSWSSVDFLHCSCPQGPVLQPSALLSPHFLWGFLPPASLPIALSSPTDLGFSGSSSCCVPELRTQPAPSTHLFTKPEPGCGGSSLSPSWVGGGHPVSPSSLRNASHSCSLSSSFHCADQAPSLSHGRLTCNSPALAPQLQVHLP